MSLMTKGIEIEFVPSRGGDFLKFPARKERVMGDGYLDMQVVDEAN